MKKDKAFAMIKSKILELMKTEGADWTRSWIQKERPINFLTRKNYRGLNWAWLSFTDFKSNEWGTFKQWNSKGYKIKKGSKASFVVFCEMKKKKADWLKGKELETYNATGDLPYYFFWRVYNVFNADQIEGYEAPKVDNKHTTELTEEDVANIEAFIADCGPKIETFGDQPYYAPLSDYIAMPDKETFFTDTAYYSTLLHELTHWTGHKSRLNRDQSGSFGSEDYAKEELVAEIGSAFLCQMQGVEKTVRADHAQYLNNWMTMISENDNALSSAFSQAQKAVDYLERISNKNALKEVA